MQMPRPLLLIFWGAVILPIHQIHAQAFQEPERFIPVAATGDPCGFDPAASRALLAKLGPGWGYNYDSLRVDLRTWRQSPYVVIDSVGASVQKRGLWRLTITSPAPPSLPRLRIWMHARTHPNEVQGWWVTDEVIKLLLGESPLAQLLRERCTFNIMPMYNPDGVELSLPRQNANGVDIESNWNKSPHEPEVLVVRNQFVEFMASPSPIRLALNMHSAIACKRYFVYHDATGTSPAFAAAQQDYITKTRQYFFSGIQNWNYLVSWVNNTPTQYPESWFWLNHKEAVMALTYEDMNCSSAGEYDKTALALLQGIVDYFKLGQATAVTTAAIAPQDFSLAPNYPNPPGFDRATTINFSVAYSTPVRLVLYDALGRQVHVLHESAAAPGQYQIQLETKNLTNGVYFYQLQTNAGALTRRLLIVR